MLALNTSDTDSSIGSNAALARWCLCDVSLGNVDGSLFHIKFDLSWGIRTNMGKTEGIFLISNVIVT